MTIGGARVSAPNRLVADVSSFCALLLLTYFIYGRVFEIRPFSGDNLYILSWADRTPESDLLRVDPDFYPEWRPLAYQTVWLQYRWSQFDQVGAYYVVNLLLWTACAWLVYRVVDLLAHDKAAGLLAAAVVVTDPRALVALTWILERQSSMACFFGLVALLIVLRYPERRPTRLAWIGISLLLLASGLSKEYGLAFAGTVAVFSLRQRRYEVAASAISAAVMYACLRIVFAGGATAPFCEDMGYFSILHHVCYDGPQIAAAKQLAYNVVASGVGSVLPGLLTGDGQIGVSPRRLAVSAVWLAAATLGWWKGPRPVRITALAVGLNAALGFMLYRDRNQLVALCAIGIAVGVGLAFAGAAMRAFTPSRLVRALTAAVLLCLLTAQAIRTKEVVASEVDKLLLDDPCDELADIRHLDPAFVRRLKTTYRMTNPECAQGR